MKAPSTKLVWCLRDCKYFNDGPIEDPNNTANYGHRIAETEAGEDPCPVKKVGRLITLSNPQRSRGLRKHTALEITMR